MTEIVTERLRLRRFRPEDLPAFVAYRSDPDVARYQSWDATYSMADAERFLANQQAVDFGAPGEWVQLAAVDKVSGELCGDCAVCIAEDEPANAEIGATFDPKYHGSGLATEAIAALITRLFADHGLHRVYAEVEEGNVAAQRVLGRLGFRREAPLVYAVLREEWEPA